ncbi:hypothetical protein [Nocardia bovistercoris]|uniref:Uncharacterized protein n=1 Tax=Nocardia bovistercoris TaxID=2785916 RepID=A0A931N3Q9_9NOCA|nr:hypothetical protein [Nocardia bovistercoris]MBH0776813.1 hypothetical protein [Nocardia bovistercoris]
MHAADPKPLVIAHPPDAIDTYRALRFGIVLVVGLIAVAQFAEWLADGDVSTSISASFYTSVHGIFVGALFAAGTCLIIYRGNSDIEDSVLNFAAPCSHSVHGYGDPTDTPTVWTCSTS